MLFFFAKVSLIRCSISRLITPPRDENAFKDYVKLLDFHIIPEQIFLLTNWSLDCSINAFL